MQEQRREFALTTGASRPTSHPPAREEKRNERLPDTNTHPSNLVLRQSEIQNVQHNVLELLLFETAIGAAPSVERPAEVRGRDGHDGQKGLPPNRWISIEISISEIDRQKKEQKKGSYVLPICTSILVPEARIELATFGL